MTALLLLSTSDALACAVCGGGGQNNGAFTDMTVFLSLFPLGMIGGVVAFVWFKSRPAAPPRERPQLDLHTRSHD